MQLELDMMEQNTLTHAREEAELTRLNQLKETLGAEGNELLEEISGFMGTFSDADMLEYIYSYAQQVNLWNDRIIIRNVSLSEGGVSDLGFNQADVTISAVVSSEKTMFAFLNYLTNKKASYRFHISEFSYPMNETSGNIQVTIPLTLYYK